MAQGSAGLGCRRGGDCTRCEDDGTRIGWVSGIRALPYRTAGSLAAGFELLQRVHVRFLEFASCCFAAATTLSGVKPNFLNRSLAGADPPKPFIAIFAPFRPT